MRKAMKGAGASVASTTSVSRTHGPSCDLLAWQQDACCLPSSLKDWTAFSALPHRPLLMQNQTHDAPTACRLTYPYDSRNEDPLGVSERSSWITLVWTLRQEVV